VEGSRKWRELGVKFLGYSTDANLFRLACLKDVERFAE
jgi:hypothetical protein